MDFMSELSPHLRRPIYAHKLCSLNDMISVITGHDPTLELAHLTAFIVSGNKYHFSCNRLLSDVLLTGNVDKSNTVFTCVFR